MRVITKGQTGACMNSLSEPENVPGWNNTMNYTPEVHFGGPEHPNHLREVLAERIAAVPPGGNIHWITYYFRDRNLAKILLDAHRRGVKITVCLAARPRTCHANDAVIAMLAGPNALGDGLRAISLPAIPALPGRAWGLQLHEKLYCFSHPEPVAFIGTFNPSGDDPEDRPDIIREIGDHNRGYNVLVGLKDPVLTQQLADHARSLHRSPLGLCHRFSAAANQRLVTKDTSIYFWPRSTRHPLIQFLNRFGRGARVRIAASHLRSSSAVNVIIALARRGANVEILTEPTLRRVTARAEQRFNAAGIGFTRVTDLGGAPMHFKFVLIEQANQAWSIFGSFNWTKPSFWLNYEIAAISTDPVVFKALAGGGNC